MKLLWRHGKRFILSLQLRNLLESCVGSTTGLFIIAVVAFLVIDLVFSNCYQMYCGLLIS